MDEPATVAVNESLTEPKIAPNGVGSYVIVVYDASDIVEFECGNMDEVLGRVDPSCVNWITLRDVHDEAAILKLLSFFQLDPFLLNEILDEIPMQFDTEYNNGLYLEYVVPHYRPQTRSVESSEGAFILGHNFVILYEHDIHRLFARTRKRLLGRQTKAQRHGPDYLLYLLLRAAVVEHYQLAFKQLTIKLEELEDHVLVGQGREEVFQEILALREEVKLWDEPLLELQDFLEFVKDAESKFISDKNARYFTKDLNREIEGLLGYYERLHLRLKEVVELHMANAGHNANRIMQLLTAVATIFLPLTFIASIYGMNFENLPPLQSPLGYAVILLVMLVVAAGSLILMKRRNWF